MEFVSLYTEYGEMKIRADQIRSFEYIYDKKKLIIDDGTEGMVVINDPKEANYKRLCSQLGT